VRVGTYLEAISPAGCFDMAGNVYEWTSSWYEAYPENTAIIKNYGQVFRVLRGGSYRTPQFQARCAMRHFDRMDIKKADYGFRCAKDVASGAGSAQVRTEKTLVN
jgi:iron(II)-dependent oxidoreductase